MHRRMMLSTFAFLAAWWLAPAVQAQDAVKIGFHAPLTGFAAADGKSAKQVAELAVQ
jgi:ABC-type branched-subunit amino acid transport system substrate-binding protein